MKGIKGIPARGERFFKRPQFRERILQYVRNGENLVISAPRRVGKTSILFDLVDNPDEEFYAVFVNTEAIKDPDEFYKQLMHAILNNDQIDEFGKFGPAIKRKLHEWAGKIGSFSIGPVSLQLEKERIDFYEQFNTFLREVKLEGRKILLLIDEFPITIENIQEEHGNSTAEHFLSQNRALRQNQAYNDKIRFIYTGSIGLFTAVKRLNATDKINDLREIKINALDRKEAILLLNELMSEECGMCPDEELADYILSKIEWWIPFYFQLMVAELTDLQAEAHQLNASTVDKAFLLVAANSSLYFEHFKSRLQKVFRKEQHLVFVHQLLLKLKEEMVNTNYVVNLAAKHDVLPDLNDILEVLKHDGYVVEEDGKFRFYSPILKAWWK